MKRINRQPRVMRVGKTQRDHETGAWAHHQQNRQLRRLENSGAMAPTLSRAQRA
jgi:hypothetical protein